MDLANKETAFNSPLVKVHEELRSMESSQRLPQMVRRRALTMEQPKSKVNASWGNTAALSPSKLSMHASMELIGDSFNTSKNLEEEGLKKEASIEAQLRRRLVRDAEIDQLLSMLQSTTFIGNYDPKHHEQWRPPSPSHNAPTISRSKFPSAC